MRSAGLRRAALSVAEPVEGPDGIVHGKRRQRGVRSRRMSRTGFAYDDRFLNHDTGEAHPERPERLRAILRGLQASDLLRHLVPLPVTRAPDDVLLLSHSQAYIERLHHACAAGDPFIDTPDSAIGRQSAEIARLAVGAVVAACEAVMSGQIDNAFCAIRPPGHHARHDRSAGFCMLNNIAIAAKRLQAHHRLGRVMILDWDVHHGDGTQDTFYHDGSVLFVSLHEDPRYCYPGTGYAHEVGDGPGRGYIMNIPMPVGATDENYHRAFDELIVPKAREFKPEFLLVSNGLDAHADDPLAGVKLSDDAFVWMMQQARTMAHELCGGPLIAMLEGGYDVGVLERCVPRQIEVLMGRV